MKNMRYIIIGAAALLVVAVLATVSGKGTAGDYEKAAANTRRLDDFEAEINTIVTVTDGEDSKTSYIAQSVTVENMHGKDLCYTVSTTATSTDMATGKMSEESNSYTFCDGGYYYDYPGVRYMSVADIEAGRSNIEKLVDIISFSSKKMINIETEEDGKVKIYNYTVDYSDVSEHVAATLESAIAYFEGVSFSPDGMRASATLENGFVTKRDFYVAYMGPDGEYAEVEINTRLKNKTAKVEKPDKEKYVNIAG